MIIESVYVPGKSLKAALYRIDNGSDSEMIALVGGALISLGSYDLNFSTVKYSYTRTTDTDNNVTESFLAPTPVGNHSASVSGASESETLRVEALLAPGDYSITVNGSMTVGGDGSGSIIARLRRYPSSLGGSGFATFFVESQAAGSYSTSGSETYSADLYVSQSDSFALSYQVFAGTSTFSTSASCSGTFTTAVEFRPIGYLSIAPDGVVYCQIRYMDTAGDLKVDYFVIQRTGSFVKTTYEFDDIVVVNASDWRGDAFTFVGSPPVNPPAAFIQKRNPFLNSTNPDPAAFHVKFVDLDVIAAAEAGTAFTGDLLNQDDILIRPVNFTKPVGQVKLVAAVAI